MLGTTEIIVIAGVIVILFGASAIPKVTRAVGRAKGEFEKGIREAKLEEQADEIKGDPDTKTET